MISVLVRVKLNVFLSEYRDSLKKKFEFEAPSFEAELKTQLPVISLAEPVWTDFTPLEAVIMADASKHIDTVKALDKAGGPPDFTAQPPEFDLEKILSVKGLVELVGTGYAWVIPTIFGFILALFSLFYGLFLIQEEKIRVSPIITNPDDA